VKIKTWTVGIAVLALAASPAYAENGLGQWNYDQDVVAVGCDSCSGGDTNCGSSVCGGGLFSGIGPGVMEGFSLSGILGLDNFSNLDVGGWTQFGYHDDVNPLSTTRGDGLSFNDVPDNLNLQQQWFYIGKEADGSNGLDFGFRADFIYGTDAQKTQSFSNPTGSFDEGFDHGVYGWAIPQLYVEAAMDDFSVKVGHFFTPVGYEVIPATGNFFYSHSLTMFNSEPFTHTGVLSTYTGYENLTIYGGWTLGWDSGFDQVGSGNIYLGGFSADLTDNVNLTYISTYGNFGARDSTSGSGALVANNPNDSYSHSIVLQVELTDDLLYVAQSDLVSFSATNAATPSDPILANDQLGLNQYLIYQYNDVLSFGSRIEWWKSDGVSHNAYTSGVNIQLLDNLVMRPEYRKDWAPGLGISQENTAVDMILTY